MNNRDSITWWASGIFVLSIALFVITNNDSFLLMMVGLYMLRPTLYAMGFAVKQADERQMLIQYRSGNLALTVVILTIMIFIVKNRMEGKPSDDFNVVLIVALAARALTGILMIKNYLEAAVRITLGVGLLMILFYFAENGLSFNGLMESIPAMVILALGMVGKKKPYVSAVAFAILTLVAMVVIMFFARPGFTFYQVITALVVSLPLGSVAYCFYRGAQSLTMNGSENI
ncbi:MAG: hypothetical protein ACOYNS_09275 [Bacteroidota bacterium]